MINKKVLLTYVILSICFFGVLFLSIALMGYTNLNWIKIFHSFFVTLFLGAIILISGKSFFDRLKLLNIRVWRVFLFAYFLLVIFLLPKIGNALVVENEGWFYIYKHPFVWLILTFLFGNFILRFFKPQNSANP